MRKNNIIKRSNRKVPLDNKEDNRFPDIKTSWLTRTKLLLLLNNIKKQINQINQNS